MKYVSGIILFPRIAHKMKSGARLLRTISNLVTGNPSLISGIVVAIMLSRQEAVFRN